ncbi:MAG: autotransporter outer membrane beta-barrel domain-containing protein [Acidaminococcus sp.]|nr:autotransporter outer membrane beta-barrel domain-containing protein [Acidaminococcus sp.]MCI2113736.1 autotransporter outer membrane beta-barrel domain-containing protein [Acidaminococcus sp.]
MSRLGGTYNLKNRILPALLAAVFPYFCVLPQVEASYLQPGETTIGGSYALGDDTFANFDGTYATVSGQTISATAISDVSISEGASNMYAIGMGNGANNNTIRLDMQGYDLSMDVNYVAVGIVDQNDGTDNNTIQILNGGDITLHTDTDATNKVLNYGTNGLVEIQGKSLTITSQDSTPNENNAFMTGFQSVTKVNMTGDIVVDVNSIGAASYSQGETYLGSEDGSILINAAGTAAGATEEGKLTLKAGKDIRLWSSDIVTDTMKYVVHTTRSGDLTLDAGNDIDIVNTIQDDGAVAIHNKDGSITSVSGGTTTITGEMGYGILNESGSTEFTAGEGIFIGGDATDYDGNAVTGALETGISASGGTVTLHSDTEVTADTAVASSGGTITFEAGAILNGIEGTAITVSDGGTVTAEDTESTKQVDGLISVTGTGSEANVVFAGSDSYLTGNVEATEEGTADLTFSDTALWTGESDTGLLAYQNGEATEDQIGTINLELNDSAVWLMTDSSAITSLSGSGGTVYYQDGGEALQVGTVTGSHTWALDLNYADHSQSDMIYVVNGTSDSQTLVVKNLSELNSQMSDGDAVRFATVKNSGGGFTEGRTYYAVDGLYNDALTVDYRTISEDPDADENYDDGEKPSQATVASLYGGDDATNIYLVKSTAVEENAGAVTPAKTRDIVWRYVTDLDTFTDRTGQIVYFTPGADQGGWVRLRYRNLGVDGVGEVDGNTYELGYTVVTRQDEERNDRFSASVSYGKESGSWEGYGGDLEIRDFTVSLFDTHEYYPSAEEMAKKPAWKQGTHSYWDNYFKYHHVKTEYGAVDHHTGLKYDGDYSQDVYSLSTEYGRVNKLDEKWSFVPQAQLQLSYLGGYDYEDSQGLHVDSDHDWSLIGRLGFDLVRDFHDSHDSKLYFKASLLHEFLDGNDVTVRYGSDRLVNEGDQSGTWGLVGLGFSSKIGDKQYFYLDAERYFGNDFERTYDIRAGVNWKF